MRVAIPLLLFVVLIGGCGGGSSGTAARDDPSTPPVPPTPPANEVPTITGSPPLSVMAGEDYAFVPSADDADGDALTFTIRNRPGWAIFDTATGRLAGTPAAADVGTTVDVTITVSDGTGSAALPGFDLEVLARPAGSATVSWNIPTTNADGSDLDDLAGFAVHYGRAAATYDDVAIVDDDTATAAMIGDLAPGTWYFAVTAFDESGNHSELSAEVSKVISE